MAVLDRFYCSSGSYCSYWGSVIENSFPFVCFLHQTFAVDSLYAGKVFMLLVSSAIFFVRNTIRLSNSLDPGQDQHSVGPDLSPNCLQRLSGDNKRSRLQGRKS